MKKVLLAILAGIALLVCASPKTQAVSNVPNIRYVFYHNSYQYMSLYTSDGVYDPPSAGLLLENGSYFYASWVPGCAPAGGAPLGTVATQQQDPVTGIWHTTSSFSIVLDNGCESATWVFTVNGGAISDTEESSYCPCQH